MSWDTNRWLTILLGTIRTLNVTQTNYTICKLTLKGIPSIKDEEYSYGKNVFSLFNSFPFPFPSWTKQFSFLNFSTIAETKPKGTEEERAGWDKGRGRWEEKVKKGGKEKRRRSKRREGKERGRKGRSTSCFVEWWSKVQPTLEVYFLQL